MRVETPSASDAVQFDENAKMHEGGSVNFDDSVPFVEDCETGLPEDPRQSSAPKESDDDAASSDKGVSQTITCPPGEENRPSKTLLQRICTLKLLIGLLLVGFIVFVIVDSTTTGYVRGVVESFLDWIEDNPIGGFFAFVIVYFLATVLFVPGSVLTLGAGFVFSMVYGLGGGVAIGSLSVFLGASLGAIAAFLLGRYLLRKQIEKLSRKYTVFKAIDTALKVRGFRIFLLLRLSPIIPFNAINYIGGVTSVSLQDYVLALFGILPGTILFVFLGASAGSLAEGMDNDGNSTVTIVVVVVGIVFGILAIWLTTRYARRELNQVVEERHQTTQHETSLSVESSGSAEVSSTNSVDQATGVAE